MMQRQIITLPPTLWHGAFDWDIDWREQSAGTSTAGRRNISINKLPRWVGSPRIELSQDMIGYFRAARLKGRGQTGIFRMTMLDTVVFDQPDLGAIPFGDGALFGDASGFSQSYTVRCDEGASAGDTALHVNMATATGPISQGQILSHDDFPFAVVSVFGGELEIEMPLRRDIPAGDLIQLRGRGLFEMVHPMTGNPGYGPNRVSTAQMQLQEWLR